MSEANDYKELSARLIERWQKENLKLNAGATDQELTAFEKHYDLILPADIRYFYSMVNGMHEWDMDQVMFSLWPLSRIQENTEGVKTIKAGTISTIEITFGDYMIDAYRYILVSKELPNYSVQVQFDEPEIVADNFTDFLRRYLSDPEQLYLL